MNRKLKIGLQVGVAVFLLYFAITASNGWGLGWNLTLWVLFVGTTTILLELISLLYTLAYKEDKDV